MSQLRPKDMTSALGISAATLRLWSNNFAPVLSPAAQKARTETGGAAQRRYTEQDLKIFTKAKELLGQGKTYEETLEALQQVDPTELLLTPPSTNGTAQSEPQGATQSLATTSDEHPVMIAFREALAAKDEVIRTKDEVVASRDETIKVLEQRVQEFRAIAEQPTPEPLKPQFRWRWLNWLIKAG